MIIFLYIFIILYISFMFLYLYYYFHIMFYTGCTCGLENKDEVENRIVGGGEVGENQYPWFAQIMIYAKIGGQERMVVGCGGSLITDRVIVTAAHCKDIQPPPGVEVEEFIHRVGLGFHDVTGMREWPAEEFEKHNVLDIKEMIGHEEWNGYVEFGKEPVFDFALVILKNPVIFSKKISPLCLSMKEESGRFEREENILVGLGASQIWYLEYDKLLGGNLEKASLIPIEMFANTSALMEAFSTDNFEEKMVQRYFKTFANIFPGIGFCIEKYEFVCKITDEIMDTIVRNIKSNIETSGADNNDQDVQAFLG